MSMMRQERPGVYSAYEASSLISGRKGRGKVGLAAVDTELAQPGVVMVTSAEQAVALLGEGDIAKLCRLLLRNGAAAVAVSRVKRQEDYAKALEALEQVEELSLVVCDSAEQTVHQAVKDHVHQCARARKERVAVVCTGAGETVEQLVQRAKALDSERVVLVGPGGVDEDGTSAPMGAMAAAVAGAIAGEIDPAVPLGGAALLGLGGVETAYSDNDVDLLVRGGVTAVECVGGEVSVVRGITTRGAGDKTWRELSTILIVDDVIPAIRKALKAKFKRAKNTQQSRGAIRAQVVLELEQKVADQIITGYDAVTVEADPAEPTVCVVDFAFAVVHGLNQIWITAHITV